MKSIKWVILIGVTIAALCMGAAIGSANISLSDVIAVLIHKVFGVALPEDVKPIDASILWSIRFPQAVMAFLVGAALAASGTVMQSVLRNPLASSYTIGVSSGA